MGAYKREYQDRHTHKPVWYFSFRYRGHRYRAAGFHTKAEADLAEQQARKTVILDQKRLHPAEYKQFDFVVKEFLEHRVHEVAESTFQREKRRSRYLIPHFGSSRVDQIFAADVLAFRKARADKGLAAREINLELTLLRSILKFAVLKEYALHNPAREVKNLPEVQTDPVMPPAERIARMFAEAAKTATAFQLVVWLYLRAYTGLRPSESFWLEWCDIEFQSHQIFVRPKSGSPLKARKFRVVEMHPALEPVLKRWRKRWEEMTASVEPKHQWVFVHPRRPGERAKSFLRTFAQARASAGLDGFRSYDLRHYFISEAIMSHVETFTIAKWSGHKSTKMIEEKYGHLRSDYRAEEMQKVNLHLPALQLSESSQLAGQNGDGNGSQSEQTEREIQRLENELARLRRGLDQRGAKGNS